MWAWVSCFACLNLQYCPLRSINFASCSAASVRWCGGDCSCSKKPASPNSMVSFRLLSIGAANIYTASLSMAGPMGFRIWAALFSGKMPDGFRFPVFACIAASASAMNTTSRPIGSWTFGLRWLCPLIQSALFRHASTEGELRRRKIVLEPGIYLKRLDWHRSHLPIDEMFIMVEAMRRILDSDADRHAIGDLDELREAVDRVKTPVSPGWNKSLTRIGGYTSRTRPVAASPTAMRASRVFIRPS